MRREWSRVPPGPAILALALAVALPCRLPGEEGGAVAARYRALPGETGRSAPIDRVTFLRHADPARPSLFAWRLEVYASGNDDPQCIVRASTSRDPFSGTLERGDFHVYRVELPGTGEHYEYRDRHAGGALLPAWKGFPRHFIPSPVPGAARRHGAPETCRYLGHVLSLVEARPAEPPSAPGEVVVLELDPELLIGTGRTFRDREGRRLPRSPERRDYTYETWTREDYEELIAAGFNSFALVPGIESWLRSRPVFYRRGLPGDAPLLWPADFYRSNYRGSVMFEDEPACVMFRDRTLQTSILHFSDFAAVLGARVRSRYERKTRGLGKALHDGGVSLGDMWLEQTDFPVWETRFETAWYQLEAGFSGFVHEGRYHLADFYQSGRSFDEWVLASTGIERRHTAEEMLRYHFAFLRGAARHHDKDWGTSIYGQADPAIAERAVTLAHDMGARWIWFWTSDHDHHLPFPEQLALARRVREHAEKHPRPSLRGPRRVIDRVIVLPRGSFLFIESPTDRKNPWDLWWLRDLDPAGANEASRRYDDFRRRAFVEIHRAMDEGADFDLTVDDGRPIRGYREVVRIAPR